MGIDAPAEMSSSFQVLPDGSLQLVSCDPGAGFDAGVRPGIARELIAWRTVELATIEAVRASGGGEAELSGAWALVQAAPVATDLMDLPATTTPAEMALRHAKGSARCSAQPADGDPSRETTSVSEVLELQGDADVLGLQHGDDVLQRVALLRRDPDRLALGLAGGALRRLLLDQLVDLLGLVGGDPDLDRDDLAHGVLRGVLITSP
jgi:hypothetical protein